MIFGVDIFTCEMNLRGMRRIISLFRILWIFPESIFFWKRTWTLRLISRSIIVFNFFNRILMTWFTFPKWTNILTFFRRFSFSFNTNFRTLIPTFSSWTTWPSWKIKRTSSVLKPLLDCLSYLFNFFILFIIFIKKTAFILVFMFICDMNISFLKQNLLLIFLSTILNGKRRNFKFFIVTAF